jgi:hypothetical protein
MAFDLVPRTKIDEMGNIFRLQIYEVLQNKTNISEGHIVFIFRVAGSRYVLTRMHFCAHYERSPSCVHNFTNVSPEHWGYMFLLNFGIRLLVYTPQSKKPSLHTPQN